VARRRVFVNFDPETIAPEEIAAAIAEREDYSCPDPGVVTKHTLP
jgi:hypothetical protein